MKHQRPVWNESLQASPFVKQRFTEQLKQSIITKAKRGQQAKSSRLFPVITAIILCGMLIAAIFVTKYAVEQVPIHTSPPDIRTEYRQQDKVLFTIFPDPNLAAGKPFGYMIQFTAPFETFAAKKLSISAYHIESGMQVAALQPQIITEPSPGYAGLERFTTTFALPLGGVWRYEVKLDDQFYGDALLLVQDSWNLSPTFDLPYTGNDGKQHRYVLVGEKGKTGFIVGSYINGKDEVQQPFTAGKSNKYMWHFWGTDEQLQGEFKVLAVKRGTTEMVNMLSGGALGGRMERADRTMPSSMALPEPGRWRLLVYINGQIFHSIVVEAI